MKKLNGFPTQAEFEEGVNEIIQSVKAQVESPNIPLTIDWRQFLLTQEPEEVIPLLSLNGAPIWTPGNHSLLIGKKKSRKTLLLVWLIVQYIQGGGKAAEVLVCDTEQGAKHVWKIREKVFILTGQWISVLMLRGQNIEARRQIIEQAINEENFKVVLIDGIRDLLGNINDPDQCTELVIWIEHLTTSWNLHIVNILHQNKTDNNARGHLGSELLNKAEITIEVELDEQAGCSLVKCESSRDVPFDPFAFTHNAEGLPELVLMPAKGNALNEDEQISRLKYVFEDGLLKYAEVIEGIMSHFKAGKNRAGGLKAEFERKGWIVKNGKDKSPDTRYKLMIGSKTDGHE